MKRRTDCRLCHKTNLTEIFKLEPSALANQFVSTPVKQETYPLDLFRCDDCGHFQLLDVVDPEIMFSNYCYVSGTSQLMRQHFRNYACSIVNGYNLAPDSVVVDIGSNDATLLKWFRALGMTPVGIDPATNLAVKATAEGIPTYNDFFNERAADEILEKYGKVSVVTANNIFAHADNLDEIVIGVKKLLKSGGVFVFECSYFYDVVRCGDFSQMYHEHTSYHTIDPLVSFFQRHGMTLYRTEYLDIHGGSIRCYVGNGDQYTVRLPDNKNHYEQPSDGSFLPDIAKFANNVNDIKTSLKNRLLQLKAEGKSIAAVAASAKSTTFLHHCGIGTDLLDFIADDAAEKQGQLTPGKHIPVLPFSAIYEKRPDYLLILSFNFVESIIAKHKDWKGVWIVPLPEYREINAK